MTTTHVLADVTVDGVVGVCSSPQSSCGDASLVVKVAPALVSQLGCLRPSASGCNCGTTAGGGGGDGGGGGIEVELLFGVASPNEAGVCHRTDTDAGVQSSTAAVPAGRVAGAAVDCGAAGNGGRVVFFARDT